MNTLLIGGFLGSGKTTVIRGILKSITEAGQTVAIIENEIGEVGIDDQLLSGGDVQVTPLFGGCVCCQISGSLISAVIKIKQDIAPDWLVIEATGLAFLTDIRDLFTRYGDEDIVMYGACIVDSSRWTRMLRASPDLIQSQVEGAEVIIINKTDIKAPDEQEMATIRSIAREGARILLSSGQDKNDSALWGEMKAAFGLR